MNDDGRLVALEQAVADMAARVERLEEEMARAKRVMSMAATSAKQLTAEAMRSREIALQMSEALRITAEAVAELQEAADGQ